MIRRFILYFIFGVHLFNTQKPDLVLVVDDWDEKFVNEIAIKIKNGIKNQNEKFEIDIVIFGENNTLLVGDRVRYLTQNGATLIADFTCEGLYWVRSIAKSSNIPYIQINSLTSSMIQSVTDYLIKMGAKDAAFIFQDRSSFEHSFCYAMKHLTIQVLLVEGLTNTNIEKLKNMTSRYSHYALFGSGFKTNEFLNMASEKHLMLGDSRWLSFLQDNVPNSFISKRNSLSLVKATHNFLCRLRGTQNKDGTCEKCTEEDCYYGHDIIKSYLQCVLTALGKVVSNEQASEITLENIEKQFIMNNLPIKMNGIIISPDLQVAFSVRSNSEEKYVGNWSDTNQLTITDRSWQSMIRRKLKIGSLIGPPFLMQVFSSSGVLIGYEGLYMDILGKLRNELDFDYELLFPEDKAFGIRNVTDGTWNGLIGQLVRGETDAIFASLSMTSERADVIDFVTPYFDQAGIGILGRKPKRQQTLFKFMAVLSPEVWWAILGAIILASLAIWFVDRNSPFSSRHKIDSQKYRRFTLKESFWFSLTSLTPQGGGEVPTSLSGRVLVAAYWLFVVLILATFTANLAALLTVERMQFQVNSLDEMVREANFKYTTLANSFTYQYFYNMAEAENELYNAWKNISLKSTGDYSKYRVWDYPIKEQYRQILKNIETTGLAEDIDEGVQRVLDDDKGRFAFVVDISIVRYRLFQDCDFTMIGEVFAEHPYALAVTKGSSLLVELGNKVSKLQRARFFEDRMSSYLNSSKLRKCLENSDNLGVFDLGGVFIALSIGLIVALLVLTIEIKAQNKRVLVEPSSVVQSLRLPDIAGQPITPVEVNNSQTTNCIIRETNRNDNHHKCKPEPGCIDFNNDFPAHVLPW